MINNAPIGNLIRFGFIRKNCTFNEQIALYLGREYRIMGDDVYMRCHLILRNGRDDIEVIDECTFSHAIELVS